MDFTITETEQQLVAGIRDLCARFPDEYWLEHDDSKVFPWEFYDAFAAGGWLGIAIPEEYGGGGLGVSAASLVAQGGRRLRRRHERLQQRAHRRVRPRPAHQARQRAPCKKEYLPRMAAGELHVSFAVTEPDAGTDTTRISTFATRSTAAT